MIFNGYADTPSAMNLIAQGFSATVNHVLARSPWATKRFQAFAGQSFRIETSPIKLDLTVDERGLLTSLENDAEPAVVLSLALSELPLMLAGGMDKLMNRVRISGNAEFAEVIGFVFRNLSWDVEDDLARVIGDIPAHRLASGARDLHQAQSRALDGLTGNLSEYLREESGWVLARPEHDAFAQEVSQLRDQLARLEKRTQRVGAGTASKSPRAKKH